MVSHLYVISALTALFLYGCGPTYFEQATALGCSELEGAQLIVVDRESSIYSNGRKLNATIDYFHNDNSGEYLLSVWTPGSSYLYTFDMLSHQIQDSTDLDAILDSTEISEIESAKLISIDEVLVNTSRSTKLLKAGSGIFNYVYPATDENGQAVEYYFNSNKFCQPSYSIKDSTLSYCVRPHNPETKVNGIRKSPYIEIFINLSNKFGFYSPVEVSTFYGQGRYGFAVNQYRKRFGDTTAYTSELDPNITLYDHKLETISIVGGKSTFDTSVDPELERKEVDDGTRKLSHLIEVSSYSGLNYNPIGKYYYRVFYKGLPLRRSDGLLNTLNDQPMYVQIFTPSFCLADEINLDPKVFSGVLVPYGKSLLVAKKFDPTTDSDYRLSEIRFR